MPYYRVFYDGFEGHAVGDLPNDSFAAGMWETDALNDGPAQVVNSVTDSGSGGAAIAYGSKCLYNNWSGSADNRTCARFRLPTNWNGGNEIFIRFRWRLHADLSYPGISPSYHVFRFFENASNDIDTGSTGTRWRNGVDALGGDFHGSAVYGDPDTAGDIDTWHLYELYLKSAATQADRDYKFWHDSVKEHDLSTSITSAFTKMTLFEFLSNNSDAGVDTTNPLYVDEFEVFCDATWSVGFDEATTGSMTDASIQAVQPPSIIHILQPAMMG